MRLLTLPPLVLLLLLVFLWLLLLVLLLWFALRPRRLETTHKATDAPKNTSETRTKPALPEDEASLPARRTVVVRQAPAKPEEGARDDAFDGYNRPADRRDDFDF